MVDAGQILPAHAMATGDGGQAFAPADDMLLHDGISGEDGVFAVMLVLRADDEGNPPLLTPADPT
jgi:hypothetical protein